MGEELTLQEKLAIVRKHYHEHKQQKTIARELCCNQSTVSRVLQQFRVSASLEIKKRSGRPSVVSDEVKDVVDKGIKKRRTATPSELANEVMDKTGRRVSERTIRRVRHELTYYPVHASVKPYLTDTHKAARLAWCREHRRDSFKSVVFMDEMGVSIDYHRQLFWIKPGEVRPVRETQPTKLRLNVWGAIWYDGKTTLHVTKENFDQNYYVYVLQEHLAPNLPLGRKRFIHDRVPWHWTRVVLDWCENNRVSLVEDFPAKSPDLNATEYVWGWMKHSVAAREPHDYETLEAAILAAWDELPQTTIRHFIDHVNSVIEEIIAADGGHSH